MKNLYLLSKFRGELMGVAIILIMIFHCGALSIGRIGVETFVLLSGVGLYFSLSKDSNPRKFFRKRLLRILPTYFLFATPIIIFYDYQYGLARIMADVTTLNILRGGRFYWFIMLIILCYLIAPLYYSIQRKYKHTVAIPVVVMMLAYFICLHLPVQSIWLQRFPSFLLGMSFGKLILECNKSENIRTIS